MLDAFKKGPSKAQHAGELQALIAASKEERAALSTMLTQIQLHTAKLATAGKSLQEVEEKAGRAHGRLDEVHARLDKAAERTKELETIDTRIRALGDAVIEAEQATAKLVGPDGELQKHQQALATLASQAVQTRASFDALKKDEAAVEELRESLREAQGQVRESAERTEALKGEFEQLRALSGQLTQELARARQATRETHDEANATVDLVKEVEQKLGPLAQLQEIARTTDERMATLNALAEHVAQKIKALDNQKHTVERAVIESNRLNEMIWNMEVQINKLDEAARQATRTEELIERVERMSGEVTAQIESGVKARESFAIDLAKLDRDRTALTEFVRAYTDRIAVERKELQAFDQRVKGLQASLAEAEKGMEGLAARERLTASVAERVDQLARQLESLDAQAAEIERKQTAVEGLEESLSAVDELARRTGSQYEHLKASRQELELLRGDIQEFYKSHAAAAELRDRLGADRAAIEAFLERTAAFSAGLPELDARMGALTSKLAIVDEETEKAASLVSLAADLDRQMTRIHGQQQYVERVEARLSTLNTLTADVDARLDEQIQRRAEVESLRSQIDGVGLQVSDAQQKLESVAAVQSRLVPLTGQLASLKAQIEKAHARFQAAQKEEAVLAEQENRLTAMLEQARAIATDATGQLQQVQSLSEEVRRSASIKDEIVQELARVQARQRDVAVQMEAADDQLIRLESVSKTLEGRRTQAALAEKRISAFEARLADLRQMAADVEHRIQTIGAREAIVDAVRQEVESVHEISARSKADLQYVEEHRGEVAALHERVNEVLACIGETESRLAQIETRKRLVDEVHLKTNVIANMLEDVRLNMETLGEQKAVMDHVMDTFNRLSQMVQEAQSTMRALAAERETAERIERGVKKLRSRTATDDKKLAGN